MKTKALFPGSFDPFTAGHLNILKRALTMFDEVVVAVGINQDKRGFFDMDKKLDIIRQATQGIPGVSVIQYDNLTIDTCRQLGIRHIVRGVRNMIDFETERSTSGASRRLASAMERSVSKSIIFLTPRTMCLMPNSRQVSMVRLSYWIIETPGRPAVACRMMSSFLSISKKPRLSWLIPTATTTSSNMERARLRIFRWPAVNGSKEPGNKALVFITASR